MAVSVAPDWMSIVTRRCSSLAGSSARTSGRYHCTKSCTMPCSMAPGFSSTHAITRGAKNRLKPSTMQDDEERDRAGDPHDEQERLDAPAAAHRSLALLAELSDAGVATVLVLSHGRGASGHSAS